MTNEIFEQAFLLKNRIDKLITLRNKIQKKGIRPEDPEYNELANNLIEVIDSQLDLLNKQFKEL